MSWDMALGPILQMEKQETQGAGHGHSWLEAESGPWHMPRPSTDLPWEWRSEGFLAKQDCELWRGQQHLPSGTPY